MNIVINITNIEDLHSYGKKNELLEVFEMMLSEIKRGKIIQLIRTFTNQTEPDVWKELRSTDDLREFIIPYLREE